MKITLLSAFTAAFCLAGCNSTGLVSNAAEYGLRQDLKAVGEVLSYRELAAEEKEAPGGRSAIVRFESEIKWLTLDEALSQKGAARDAQEYLGKMTYAASRLGREAKAGRSASVKGAILMAKTDTGWIYKGLTGE
ncbi:MAG: hypothetical protein HY550_09870 [Elusimicrobia bacterium]|nr:hypothetical protein [Elusimicrobiota bacterium]